VLGIAFLGVGIAGSVALTGSAEHRATAAPPPRVSSSRQPQVPSPSAFDRKVPVSRSLGRSALDATAITALTRKRAADLGATDERIATTAQRQAVRAREKRLRHQAVDTKKKARALKAKRAERKANRAASRKASLPVTSGYRIAATFGQVGSWSRYHTGYDFSAPVGTPIHAPTSGTVTNAGSGSASGWAGTYVTIKHADGSSTLYAHMSQVSVHVGESVSAGQRIGAIGLTGRTFGAHLHFEVYPAGVKVGDVYSAVDPLPWLHALGLHP
jgi:murein DD-endopeptidase MepM/ murein hydrolase activator NlpD